MSVTTKRVVSPLRAHIQDLKEKRGNDTLEPKRTLGKVFKERGYENIGMSKRYVDQAIRGPPLYGGNESKVQKRIEDFFNKAAVFNPCKSSKQSKILLKPVKGLHKEFCKEADCPKVHSFCEKIKFKQCLCEICLDPKLKLLPLDMCVNANTVVSERMNMHSLLQRSVCPYNGEFPKRACIDHVCAHCGVESLWAEVESVFQGRLKQSISWSRGESVKQGSSSRVDKVRKTSSDQQCFAELVNELGPLFVHIFNAEWQRKQFNQLKAELLHEWELVVCD